MGCSCCCGDSRTALVFGICRTPWLVAIRLLFRWGELFAAASLSSAEAEELEPVVVCEDEVGCMGLIFWLSGVLAQMGQCSPVDRMGRAKFLLVAGMADCVVRGN